MSQHEQQTDPFDDSIDPVAMFRAVAELARDERAFRSAIEAYTKHDADGFRAALEAAGLAARCHLVCRWLCLWHCHLVCLRLGGAPHADETTRIAPLDLARAVVHLTEDRAALQELVKAVEHEAADDLRALLGRKGLSHLLPALCIWFCEERCRLFCRWVCTGGERPSLLGALHEAGSSLAVALHDPRRLDDAFAAYERGDILRLRDRLDHLTEGIRCWLVCRWFCFLVCWRRCTVICRPIPIPVPVPPPWPELREQFLALGGLAREEVVAELGAAFDHGDTVGFHRQVESLRVGLFCFTICRVFRERYCVRICHLVCVPVRLISLFSHVGGYDYASDVDSGATGTGLTKADNRAFFSTVRLRGVLTQQSNGQPLEYRFEGRHKGGSWHAIPLAYVAPTEIGFRQIVIGGILFNAPIVVNGVATVLTSVPAVTPDGWIQVPQGTNVSLNGQMINLILPKAFSAPSIDVTGITAGKSTLPAGLGSDLLVGLRMMIRAQGTTGNGTPAGTCETLAVSTQLYDDVTHGGSWAPTLDQNQLGVAMLNLDEIAGGCKVVTDALTARYTAAHPNLGGVAITMTGPGGPYSFTLIPNAVATAGDQFGFAKPNGFVVADLEPCAYLVTLHVALLLTDGDNVPGELIDQVAFCRH